MTLRTFIISLPALLKAWCLRCWLALQALSTSGPNSTSKTVSNSSDSPTELLEFTAIATALVFFAGWEYSRAYYRVFDIAPGLLEFQAPSYFVWASRPLIEYWYLTVVAVIAVSLVNHFRRLAVKGQFFWTLLTILLLLLLFPAVSAIAQKVGYEDGKSNSKSPHGNFALVTVHLKDREKADRDALQEGAGVVHGDQYYLIGLHRGMYYFMSIDSASSARPFVIPLDSVSSLIFQR